jgi:S-adenosylmethionine:tRNA ribosyltransferase-isomerase
MGFPKTQLSDFLYELPHERIAAEPQTVRDTSKLLVCNEEGIKHKSFTELPQYINRGDRVYFNNAKVIPARVVIYKETGARVELFLLEPLNKDYNTLYNKNCVIWKCLIGNKRKWKQGVLQREIGNTNLNIEWENRERDLVKFTWTGGIPFVELLDDLGKIPLPPYIKREATERDKDTYQTVYAKEDGAVAAPTAGLHFTEEVLKGIEEKGGHIKELTLFVGAGTFKPVDEEDVSLHDMHTEKFSINRSIVESFIEGGGRGVCVGTTSLRVVESLYWMGVKLIEKKDDPFYLHKEEVYELTEYPLEESLGAILRYMEKKEVEFINGETGIFIVPGYKFRLVDVLITNFHMPGSTLIMLIGAFLGEAWKKVYESALKNGYRFLSYGDSSLLERSKV